MIQVDCDDKAIGRHRRVHLGVVGDVALTANAVAALLERNRASRWPRHVDRTGANWPGGTGYRSAACETGWPPRSAGATSRSTIRATETESIPVP